MSDGDWRSQVVANIKPFVNKVGRQLMVIFLTLFFGAFSGLVLLLQGDYVKCDDLLSPFEWWLKFIHAIWTCAPVLSWNCFVFCKSHTIWFVGNRKQGDAKNKVSPSCLQDSSLGVHSSVKIKVWSVIIARVLQKLKQNCCHFLTYTFQGYKTALCWERR